MHVLTPAVMELLGRLRDGGGRACFPRRWPSWRGASSTWRWKKRDRRYDIGARYGLLTAQMALALNGRDRGEVLPNWWNCWPRGSWAAAGGGRVSQLTGVIAASDPAVRDRSLDEFCREATLAEMLAECEALDRFRRSSDNLYERVRALFFLYAIHRFHIPARPRAATRAHPVRGLHPPVEAALRGGHRHVPGRSGRQRPQRRHFQRAGGRLSRAGLPDAGRPGAPQRALGARQPVDVPHRPSRRLSRCASAPSCWRARPRQPLFPILREATPVRMDLTHSGWSDIFFLGMDFPEGARVLNISIDLAVRGRRRPRAQAARGSLLPRDRPAGAAAGERGSEGRRGDLHRRRGLRFRARLPGAAEGGRDRFRHRAAGHGRVHAAAGGAAGAR